MVGEGSFAETDGALIAFDQLRITQETHVDGIEVGIGEIPELDPCKIIKMHVARNRLGGSFGRRNSLGTFGDDAITVAKIDFESERFPGGFEMQEEVLNVQRGIRSEYLFGLSENIFDESGRNNAEGNFAIDSAKGEVVNLVPKGRDVRALARIDVDSQNILTVEIEMGSEIEREGGVATFVLAKANAVNPNGGGGHHAFEIDEDMLSLGFRRQTKPTTIKRDELIGSVIETVPGQAYIGVRDDDTIKGGVVKFFAVGTVDNGFAVSPIAIDGNDQPAIRRIEGRERRITSESARCKGCASEHGGGGFEEVASFHGFPFARRRISV